MQFTPGIVQPLADMPIGVAPFEGVEIAYHDEGIRTAFYLIAYGTGLFIA
jgi:hypothetical protein